MDFERKNDISTAAEGFTLIELMMSIAILGIITAVTAMVLSSGVESWRIGMAMADEAHHADAVMEQLVTALRSAYYPETSAPTYEYGFRITDDGYDPPDAADRISWVKVGNSLIGENVPWAGAAHRVEVFISDDHDKPGLYVKAWPVAGLNDNFDPGKDVEPTLLSDEVVSLNCRMLDPEKEVKPLSELEWINEWEPSNRIPAAVEITIGVAQPGNDEPALFSRYVPIPISDLSWNPVDTTENTAKRGHKRNDGQQRNAVGRKLK